MEKLITVPEHVLLHRYECFTVKYATRIDFIRNYIRDTSDILPYPHDIADVIPLFFSLFFCVVLKHSYLCNKKKITRWLEHMKFIFSWKKDFFPLEDKLHMFALPCNILYILNMSAN